MKSWTEFLTNYFNWRCYEIKKVKSSTIVCSTESITHDCDILYY